MRGAHYSAGLLGGFLPVQFDGGRQACGAEGYLEAYVGTWGLKEMAGDPNYDYARLAADYAAEAYVLKRVWTPWGRLRFATSENPESSVTLGLHALFAEDAKLG